MKKAGAFELSDYFAVQGKTYLIDIPEHQGWTLDSFFGLGGYILPTPPSAHAHVLLKCAKIATPGGSFLVGWLEFSTGAGASF